MKTNVCVSLTVSRLSLSERPDVRPDADSPAQGFRSHHWAAGHGSRRRVQRGLQRGATRVRRLTPFSSLVSFLTVDFWHRRDESRFANSTLGTGRSRWPSRGPSLLWVCGRRPVWGGVSASCQIQSGKSSQCSHLSKFYLNIHHRTWITVWEESRRWARLLLIDRLISFLTVGPSEMLTL